MILPFLSRPLLAACLALASAVPAGAQTVAEVQVTPETLTLAVGGRQTLFATAYDRQGKEMDIPAEMRDAVDNAANALMESAAEGDATKQR